MERKKPKLMRAQVQNADGTKELKTIRVDDLGEIRRHESLQPELAERAEKLFARIGSMLQPTMEKWLDGFLCDQNPDREIAIWERIADVADKLWVEQPRQFSNLDRKKLTTVIIAISSGLVDIPSQIKGVTDDQVKFVRAAYEAA
jgi:hypothetical protein